MLLASAQDVVALSFTSTPSVGARLSFSKAWLAPASAITRAENFSCRFDLQSGSGLQARDVFLGSRLRSVFLRKRGEPWLERVVTQSLYGRNFSRREVDRGKRSVDGEGDVGGRNKTANDAEPKTNNRRNQGERWPGTANQNSGGNFSYGRVSLQEREQNTPVPQERREFSKAGSPSFPRRQSQDISDRESVRSSTSGSDERVEFSEGRSSSFLRKKGLADNKWAVEGISTTKSPSRSHGNERLSQENKERRGAGTGRPQDNIQDKSREKQINGARVSFRGRQRTESWDGTETSERKEWSKPPENETEQKRKKEKIIEPVHFLLPISKCPHIAILGGGMSGLMCALSLEDQGIRSTVFDTGRHGLGGRMGTRDVDLPNGSRMIFDHAAQFFTVTDDRFQKFVDRWISEGAVEEWKGNVGNLRHGGQYAELERTSRYIGKNGMRSLSDHIVSQSKLITVRRPCWISRMEASNGLWSLSENRKPEGEFDAVVIAHNGKCANRLLATAGVPSVARQMKRLELSSIWALLAAFEEPLPVDFDGAFVEGVDAVSWMGNNTSKLAHTGDKSFQCWTFFSTGAYGKRNKVPQESIPTARAQKVKQEMLRGVEQAIGVAENSLPPVIYSRLQLWGAALPRNTPNVPCIFDAQGRVGICGDWLLGSSLEAAALSGLALGNHIANYRDFVENKNYSIGLEKSFLAVDGHDIGQFPGTVGSELVAYGMVECSAHDDLKIAFQDICNIKSDLPDPKQQLVCQGYFGVPQIRLT